MIFVTVGTHEQQFNRLIKEIDDLKYTGIIKEDVFMQIGYSTYEPKHCTWKKIISYSEMEKFSKDADIIITHGGPASFMKALQYGKIPIVVPRQVKYEEHVNDHQVDFVKLVSNRFKNILPVFDISDLGKNIIEYSILCGEQLYVNKSNNREFNRQMQDLLASEDI